MEPVLTPEEMGAADRRTIEAGTPIEVLMDRAGRAVAWAIRRRLGRAAGVRAVVACGKGNNGGDGRVAARVLRGWGARVDVVDITQAVDETDLERAVARADVVVDAMYGTGFRGELTDAARAVAEAFAAFSGPVVAVDIPSGVDGSTGAISGIAVRADETVCFAARKPGVCFEPGRSLTGLVRVVDIGIDLWDERTSGPTAFLTEAADVAAWLPPRHPDDHKWTSGCFVVGGSDGMTGAPMLAAHAAMRAGAGIVWCGVPGSEPAARAAGSEVITKALPAGADGSLTPDAADIVLDGIGRFRSLAVGPGLGRSPGADVAVRSIVAAAPVPVVVDADGLRALAGHLEGLRDRPVPAVLTPHAGEYAALAGHPPDVDRIVAARSLAAVTGAVVLLKGPGTVVADAGGRVAICPVGGPWLATAGTGDVLTGIVAGFLARGLAPFEAAAAGAYVHGAAADQAGHTGLVAGDLVGAIPAALDALTDRPER